MNKVEQIFADINNLLESTIKREILITVSNDEFLGLFDKMKEHQILSNHITKSIAGISGNVTSFAQNGNVIHFKIKQ